MNDFFTFLCDCAPCKLQALQNLQIVLLVTRPPGAIPRQKNLLRKHFTRAEKLWRRLCLCWKMLWRRRSEPGETGSCGILVFSSLQCLIFHGGQARKGSELYDCTTVRYCFNRAFQLRAAQRAWLEPFDAITPSQQCPLDILDFCHGNMTGTIHKESRTDLRNTIWRYVAFAHMSRQYRLRC